MYRRGERCTDEQIEKGRERKAVPPCSRLAAAVMLLSAAAHLMEPPQVGAAASCASATSGTNVRLRSGVKRLKSTLDAVGATQALRTDARRRRGVRYRHYDFDGDVDLDWEEFYSIQPRKIREQYSAASIRKWFNAVYAKRLCLTFLGFSKTLTCLP